MAEMLSFLESKSASYVLKTEGRVSRPDENFARLVFVLQRHKLICFSIIFAQRTQCSSDHSNFIFSEHQGNYAIIFHRTV